MPEAIAPVTTDVAATTQTTTPPAETASPFSKVDAQVKAAKPAAEPVKAEAKISAEGEAGRDDRGKFTKAETGPRELRAELDRHKTELKTLAEGKTALERKIVEYEARGKDTTALAEKLSALQKERDELKGQLSASRFETSEPFKRTYETPFNQAVEVLKQEIGGWQIVDASGDPTRVASFRDFKSVYSMERPDAKASATRLFGDDASNVMSAYDQLHRMENTMNIALETERKNWQVTQTESESKRITEREAFRTLADRIEKDLAEANPDWYGERPADKQHNELRAEGYRIVNLRPQKQEEAAIWWADVKHRAANFAPAQRQIALLKSENEALKAKLNGRKESEPGAGRRPTETVQGEPDKDWRSELREQVPAV